MKTRKKTMVLRGDRNTGKWYLAERVEVGTDGVQFLGGKVYDVSDSVNPAISHTNTYVRRLEDALIQTVRDLFKAQGLTCTDHDLMLKLKSLKDEVS